MPLQRVRRRAEHLDAHAVAEVDRLAGHGDEKRDVVARQLIAPGVVGGGFALEGPGERAADLVALQQLDEAGDVVVLGVRQDDEVDAALGRRQLAAEGLGEARAAGPAVDEDARAGRRLDEQGVALADVEDGEAEAAGLRAQVAPPDKAGSDEDQTPLPRARASARRGARALYRWPAGRRWTSRTSAATATQISGDLDDAETGALPAMRRECPRRTGRCAPAR